MKKIVWEPYPRIHVIKCLAGHKKITKRMSIKTKTNGVQRLALRPSRSWSKRDSDLVVDMRRKGHTYKEIGKMVGRSAKAVFSYQSMGGYEGMLARQRSREQMATLEAAMDDMAI